MDSEQVNVGTPEDALNDPKSTTDIRMIAQDVTAVQAAICSERRGRVDDRLSSLSRATAENTKSVDDLTKAVAALSATVTQLAATVAYQSTTLAAQGAKVADHETKLAVLTLRVGIAAVVGGSLPALVQWIYSIANH